MNIQPIKTRTLVPPRDDLFGAIKDVLSFIPEKSILAVTSKVVSIGEGNCISRVSIKKDDLVKEEADLYLPRELTPHKWIMQTMKRNLLIPMAGIDESNADNYYILWPHDPAESARMLHGWAKETYKIKDVGIIITDSHTIACRRGTLGISIAHYGFNPLRDYRGVEDIFGRKMKISLLNIADSLASAAVVTMGEGAESTPLALITDIPWVEFIDQPIAEKPDSSFELRTEEDLYYPLIKNVPWKKGGGGKK